VVDRGLVRGGDAYGFCGGSLLGLTLSGDDEPAKVRLDVDATWCRGQSVGSRGSSMHTIAQIATIAD
jgi:hypothetical protein